MTRKKIKLKIVKVMKIVSKTRPSHLLLSITFYDKSWIFILIFYIWVLSTTIKATMKGCFNLNNILLLLLGVPPKKTMVLEYQSIFLVHFTMLAPNYKCLYSKFANHHICIIFWSSVHHIDNWNCPKYMQKTKYQ